MRRISKVFTACMIFVGSMTVIAQNVPATGLYAFGSFDSPGFDTINRGNLNIHFTIPIISKTGRGGTNFYYALTYDGLIWTPISSSGTKTWSPSYEWGWTDTTNAEFGYITYNLQSPLCSYPPGGLSWQETDFVYHDAHGFSHYFPMIWTQACDGPGPPPTGSGIYSTSDNSGYTIYRSNGNYIVFSRGGAQNSVAAYPNLNGGSTQLVAGGTFTDTNGNEITATSTGTFTDTTGKTVLTITGAGTASSPTVYKYTDSNGNPDTVTVNYTNYNIKTNFGVSGTGEYSQPAVPLVSSIAYSADGSSYTFTYEPTPGESGYYTGRIASVKLRTGGTISYAYTGGNNGIEPDGTTAELKRTTADSSTPTTYTRSGVSSTASTTTIVNPAGNTGVYTFLENASGFFYESGHSLYTGGASGTPIEQVTTCYNEAYPCSNPNVNTAFSTVAVHTVRDGVTIGTDTQTYTGPELLASDAGPTGVTTTNTYKTLTGQYGIPFYRLASRTVASSAGTASKATYNYDETTPTPKSGLPQHIALSTQGGNLTSVDQLVSGTTMVTTSTVTYDNAGQVLTAQDANQNTTTYGYDLTDTLVTKVTRPTTTGVAHISSAIYDIQTGLMTSSTDENGQTTTYTYDGMERPHTIVYPDQGNTTYSFTPTSATQETAETSSTTLTTTVDLDGYGRTAHVYAPNGSITDTSYDADGRTYCVSNPHGSGGSPTDGNTCYTYDVLDRVLKTTNPDNSTKTASYSGETVMLTDESGHQRQMTLDALGRIVTVLEPNNTTGALTWETDYTWNNLNELHTVTQKGDGSGTARVRTFNYDNEGRLTSQVTPEQGTTGYGYDNNGNLTSRVDARNITTTYTYDALNRKLTERATGLTNNYFYDAANGATVHNAIGRLAQEGNGVNANEIYSYDTMGRVNWEASQTPSVPNDTAIIIQATYDLAGNMTSLTYPDGRVVKQSYDQGQLTGVNYASWNGQSVNYNYLASATYGPSGLPQSMVYGNGVTGSYSWNNRLQPFETVMKMTADGTNQAVYDKHYCYGPADSRSCTALGADNGDILRVLDMLTNNQSQGFSYDNLNRLVAFNNGENTMAQSFSIDPWGNLTQSGTQSFQTAYTANNQINSSGFGYDAAGNLTQANFGISESFAYDADGHLTNFDNGAATYTYDALGQRVRKDVPGNWTEYIYWNGVPLTEKNSDGSWSDYIYANGQRMARADSYDERIHTHGTFSGTGEYALWHLPFNGYTVQNGDKISWRQYQAGGGKGGVVVSFTDGSSANWQAQDQNGQDINSATTQNQWFTRTVDLSAYAGKTVSSTGVVTDSQTGAVTWDEYYSDLAIVSADGTVTTIYERAPAISLTESNSAGVSNATGVVERTNTAGDSEYPGNTTTYYLSDQIGSARMLLAAGGWPVSEDTYYPYGVEPTPAADANHYKFAGMERDAESSLDHTWFRQYAATAGRFLSPDPSNGSYDLGNPQSFDRYSYVMNNPVAFVDPSGQMIGCFLLCGPDWGDAGSGDLLGGGIADLGWAAEYAGELFDWLNLPVDVDEYIWAKTNTSLGGGSVDNIPFSATLEGYGFWITATVGNGFDVLTQSNFGYNLPGLTPPTVRTTAPNNGNQPSWQQKMRQAAHSFCGKSPGDRVAKSVLMGAGIGAVTGGIGGFVGGEVFGGEVTLGATGPVGAFLGAHVGAAVGAMNGLTQGAVLAGICYAGFEYDD